LPSPARPWQQAAGQALAAWQGQLPTAPTRGTMMPMTMMSGSMPPGFAPGTMPLGSQGFGGPPPGSMMMGPPPTLPPGAGPWGSMTGRPPPTMPPGPPPGAGPWGSMAGGMPPTMPPGKGAGKGEAFALPSMFGSVNFNSQGGSVVPSPQTMAQWHPDSYAHPAVQQPKEIVERPKELVQAPFSELRRQELAQQLWQAQEEDVSRRVTMLENLIRRTIDLPSVDVAGIERKKAQRSSEEYEEWMKGHSDPFVQTYMPVMGRDDYQVSKQVRESEAPANMFYVEPQKAQLQAQAEYMKMEETMKYRRQNPVTMFMAGDYQYLQKALYLDRPNDNIMYGMYGGGYGCGNGYGMTSISGVHNSVGDMPYVQRMP